MSKNFEIPDMDAEMLKHRQKYLRAMEKRNYSLALSSLVLALADNQKLTKEQKDKLKKAEFKEIEILIEKGDKSIKIEKK